MLCPACQSIFDGAPKRPHEILPDFYIHHESALDIEAAAKAGCFICSTIWDKFLGEEKQLIYTNATSKSQVISGSSNLVHKALSSIYGLWMDRSWTHTLRRLDHCMYGWKPAQLEHGSFQFSFGHLSFPWKQVGFQLAPCKDVLDDYRKRGIDVEVKAIDECVQASAVERRMDSDAVWSNIHKWTSECSQGDATHSRCHKHIQDASSGVASRLIDVMSGESGEKIRLTTSTVERQPLPYATLSYCWGPNIEKSKLHLLRKSTLSEYQKEIPQAHLPQLFRDVVKVARKLNVRYVWIDAYCIIQDDNQDWEIEAARMGDIYMHALINIAAGGAHSADDPLMPTRNPVLVEPCRTSVDWRNLLSQEQRDSSVLAPFGSFYVFGMRHTEDQMLDTPLNRRAWVMQEQQLSPRILHFGKYQVFWQCWAESWKANACETFPEGIPPIRGNAKAHRLGLFTSLPAADRKTYNINIELSWQQHLMAYSHCNISFESDRLIAVSGLASKFAEATGHSATDYAAGLWRDSLPLSLCWYLDPIGPRSHRPEEALAPSWSWASVKGGHLRSVDDDIAQRAALLGFKTSEFLSKSRDSVKLDLEPVSTNLPFGRVKYGRISFAGYIIAGKHLRFMLNPTYSKLRGQWRNVVECTTWPELCYIQCQFDDYNDFVHRKRQMKWQPAMSQLAGVALIPIVSWEHATESKMSHIKGLIVARDDVDGTYRRLGIFVTGDDMHIKFVEAKPENVYEYIEEKEDIVIV